MTMTKAQITAEPGRRDILISRDVAAPRDLVFRAYTDPALIAQWFGPRRLDISEIEYDASNGGRWRIVHTDAEGNRYGFHGVHHGDSSPENGVVRTFEFEGAPGHVSMETAKFLEHGGTTTIDMVVVFQSVEARDAHIESGMEGGLNESLERLDEVVASLAPVG
ncbi:MAG: Activator of Hsp90 ATPase 1 family protein [Frankiales bacterium]|nr:Activator of Hsp90 ATPase 1 family protein [Frankiales bacterium]